jgi:hypothetical protein
MMLILLILALVFPFLYKYSFVTTNQFTQIPIILSFMDRNYLINDWYVTVSKAFGPRTIFAWYMAQTAKISSLPITFFLHYLLYIFLIIMATYKLTYLVFKRKFIALATTVCVLFGTTISLGGNILVTQDFVAPQLPLALSLLAVVLLLEKKYLFSGFLFSLASYFHPLIGFESASLFFFIYLTVIILSKQSITEFVKKGLIPYLVLTSPAIYLYFSEGMKTQIDGPTKISILAFMRSPHHFLASSFSLYSYLSFFFLLILFVIFVYFLRNVISKPLSKFFSFSFIAIIFACFLGYITTEITPFYLIAVLQPFRLTLYMYWIAAVVIFGIIFYLSDKHRLFYLLLFIPIFLTNPDYFSSIGKVKLITIFIGLLIIIFYKVIPKKLFIIFLLVFFSLERFHDKFNFSSYVNIQTDETKIAEWVKFNTPSDAILLTPPEFEKFRLVANRAIVADWKALPFQEESLSEWAKRMCDIGNIKNCNYQKTKVNQIIAGYRTLSREDILNLANKYQFDYMISEVDYPSFNKIYRNRFRIYKIR